MPPRATLITRSSGLAFFNNSRPMRPMVSLVFGRCTVRKSARATSSSRLTASTPISRARSSEMYGSYAMTRIAKPAARSATNLPIRPRPTIPRVFSASSTPSHLLRSHRPATNAACACGTLRAIDNNKAIVCSAAEMMLEVGAFTTMTPRFVAASTSTLSSPTPARPTT